MTAPNPALAHAAAPATAGPSASLRTRLHRWFTQRLPRTNHWTLTQRNLYVLPSGAGWMLGATSALLLIAAINYQINLGFLFAFMLAGVTFVSVLMAHGNLRGLQWRAQEPAPVFAHQAASLPVFVQHTGGKKRFAIGLRFLDGHSAHTAPSLLLDAPPGEASGHALTLPALPRGLHASPPIAIETRFPMGAFRVWSIWRPAVSLLVYPAPESNAPALPQSQAAGAAGLTATRSPSFEMEGFRSYQRGDPIKSILWKKTATALATGSGDWVRRDHTQLGATELWLDHASTGLHHPEAVLSRLCAWVIQADTLGLSYGLRLPQTQIEPGQGAAHKHQCLRALALS